MGHGFGPPARGLVGAFGHGDVPGVLAPRRDPRHRQPRCQREALGDEHRPGASVAPGTPRRRLRPGLRTGRPADGHGRLRRLGPSLGARGPDLLPRRLPRLSRRAPEPGLRARQPIAARSRHGGHRPLGRQDRLGLPTDRERGSDGTGRGPRRHALRHGRAGRESPL